MLGTPLDPAVRTVFLLFIIIVEHLMLQINATDCINRPVGLQNPDYVPDSAFTANYDHGTFSPHMARTNSGGGTRNMWIAGAVNNWVQVDLGQMYTVFAIG